MLRRKNKRVVCFCMDGTSRSLLVYLMEKGVMPNVARVVEQGTFSEAISSVPEISNVAWTTIFTGTNSAVHGIFGFVDLQPYSYKIRFPSFLDVRVPTLWERLSEKDKRSIIINIPATYPAKPLFGKLVSGFVAVDLQKACWPKEWAKELEKVGYIIDVDVSDFINDREGLVRALEKSIEVRGRVILELFEREEFDLFWVVITETDRLHHFLFDAAFDDNHPLHKAFLGVYRRIDELLGELLMKLDDRTSLFLFSDHGFTELELEVNINFWLQKNGYLKFEKSSPQSLEDISDKSVAFALDPARIFLNLRGRFPKGRIEPSDREKLIDELASELVKLKAENGEPIISRIFRSEEVYFGPLVNKAPDLILVSNKGFDLKGRIRAGDLFSKAHFVGMHTRNDAFFIASNRKTLEQPLEIERIYSILSQELEM